MLALRAVESRTAALDDSFDRPAAARTAGLRGRTQRSSSRNSRARRPGWRSPLSVEPPASMASVKHLLDGADEPLQPVERDRTACPPGMNARAVQRLADVDIAKARDDPLVDQQQLDRRGAAVEPLLQVAIGSSSNGSGPSALNAGHSSSSSVRDQIDRSEAPRIVEREARPVVGLEQRNGRAFRARTDRSANCPTFRDGRPSCRRDRCGSARISRGGRARSPVLPSGAGRGPAGTPAASPAPCFDPGDPPALEHARQAADRRLDFGKLGHRPRYGEAAQPR